MNIRLFPVKSLLLSLFCLPALSLPSLGQNAPRSVPGEILVGMRVGIRGPIPIAADVEATVGHVAAAHPQTGIYRIKLAPGLSEAAAIARMRQRPDVLFAEPNYIRHVLSIPNETGFVQNQYGPVAIKADLAWDIWKPQTQVTVAIIDTGIDSTHPDLTNKMLRDAQGNVLGYNAITHAAGTALDDYGHGTHCAGIAAAQTNNSIGIAGISGWTGQAGVSDVSTKLMPVKVLDSKGEGGDDDIADGITWAADHGARIISISLGSNEYSDTLNTAVQYAWGKGCLIVAAAGNDGSTDLVYPAAYSNVISVAATDKTNTLTPWSTYGSWVTTAAPGADILSTTPTYALSTGIPRDYAYMSGTSMAAPHVAGEAALIFGMFPSLTNAQISSYITTNVSPYNPINGHTIAAGGGLINVLLALQAASGTAGMTTATFANTDKTTQGNWKGKYGAQGYQIINDSASLPSYVAITPHNQNAYTWAASTSDPRALLKGASATDRIAACWYQNDSFILDLNLGDGQAHSVSLYCLCWDEARTQKIEITDAATDKLLDTETLSSFVNGTYLTWNLKGYVRIKFSRISGYNAVLSGLFIDAASTAANSAQFVSTDTTTQGSWKGKYGASGYSIVNDSASLPAYAQINAIGASNYTWVASTTDVRAMQKANSTTDRIAACLYQYPEFSLDVNLTDGQTHSVSLYCLNWDNGRSQKIEVLDGDTGALLDTQPLDTFVNGKYLTWSLKGHIRFRFITLSGFNAVVSGIFVD